MKLALVLALSLCALRTAPSYAQLDSQSPAGPPQREGLTVSVGAGAGSARIDCSLCAPDRQTAPSVYLRVGYAWRPDLILAWEINGWAKSEVVDGVDGTISIGTGTATVQWYPVSTAGFFLSTGAGVSGLEVLLKQPESTDIDAQSMTLGYHIGGGYDIRLRRNFSLTPYATYFATTRGRLGGTSIEVSGNAVQIGLGATWH
jgi:hypothetical protein